MWFRCVGLRCNPQSLHRFLVLPLIFFSFARIVLTLLSSWDQVIFLLGIIMSLKAASHYQHVAMSFSVHSCWWTFVVAFSCFLCGPREPLALCRWGQGSGRFDEALYSVLERKELFVPGSRNHNFKFIFQNNNKLFLMR